MQTVTHAWAEIAGTMHGSAQYLLDQMIQTIVGNVFMLGTH